MYLRGFFPASIWKFSLAGGAHMAFEVCTAQADAKTARNLGDLDHQGRLVHHQMGQRLSRCPSRGHPPLRAVGKMDGRSRRVSVHFDHMIHALDCDNPIVPNTAFVIVHRATDLGAANF